MDSPYQILVSYQLQEKYADAIKEYDIVLRSDSMSVHAWFFQAICHQGLGAYDQALAAYDRTLELNNNNEAIPELAESWEPSADAVT